MLLPVDVVVAVLYYALTRLEAPAAAAGPAGHTLLATAGAVAYAAVANHLIVRLACGYAYRRMVQASAGRELFTAASGLSRGLLLIVYLYTLEALDWPAGLPLRLGAGDSLLVRGAVGLAPYLAALALSWVSLRRLDELTSPRRWTRRAYVGFRARASLFVLVPWLLVLGLHDVGAWLLPGGAHPGSQWAGVLELAELVLVLGLLAVFAPKFLAWIWQCEPLPAGRLRERLHALEARAGVRFRRIYRWRLGGSGFLNAAALGIARRWRYLLLSQGLLENLDDEEVLGVVGHELGHVRHHHLPWTFLYTVTFFWAMLFGLEELGLTDRRLMAVLLCLGMAGYLRFVYGFVSRRFERQADLYALDLLGRSEPLVRGLERLAELSGGTRRARSWTHRSIGDRVAFLRAAERDPGLARAHHAQVVQMRRLGVAACAVVLAWSLTWLVPRPSPGRAGGLPAGFYGPAAHARRLARLLPEDPEGPLRLARLLLEGEAQGQPSGAAAARTWAQEALDRAQTPEQRDRARALIEAAREASGS